MFPSFHLLPNKETHEYKQFFGNSISINISKAVFNLRHELISLQQHFHQHPELSNKEYQTSNYITNYLHSINTKNARTPANPHHLQIQTNVANSTGIIATLQTSIPGPCILLRADMDALPIQENTNLSYTSHHKNIMHACGHDYHIAILLITTKILCSTQPLSLKGTIKFLFQPAEEIGGGAKNMIEDRNLNIMKNVDQVYGLHVSSLIPLGIICLNNHQMLAGCSNFTISMKGVGGHGAYPHQTNDVIVASAALIQQIQTIVSRNVDPRSMGVISIGSCHAGSKGNIITGEELKMQGTMRWFTSDTEKILKKRLGSICKGIREMFELKSVGLVFDGYTYPSVVNSQVGYENVCSSVLKIVGECGLDSDVKGSCGSEDFSEFLNVKPGAFFFVGGAKVVGDGLGYGDIEEVYAHHSDGFRIDQRCLVVGCQAMVQIVLDLLIVDKNESRLDEYFRRISKL